MYRLEKKNAKANNKIFKKIENRNFWDKLLDPVWVKTKE